MRRFTLAVFAVLFSFASRPGLADEHAMHHSSPQREQTWSGTGVIQSWNETDVSIRHLPIRELNWPTMTMRFDLAGFSGEKLPVGENVTFSFRQTASGYALVSLTAN